MTKTITSDSRKLPIFRTKFVKIAEKVIMVDGRLTNCTPPCRRRRYKTKLLYESNFDCVKYFDNHDDNATIEVRNEQTFRDGIFYLRKKFF
jgi:hypothetical protein